MFMCPAGTVFDDTLDVCNWPWAVPGCGTTPPLVTSTQPPPTAAPTTTAAFTDAPVEEEEAVEGEEEAIVEATTAVSVGSVETEEPYTPRYGYQASLYDVAYTNYI